MKHLQSMMCPDGSIKKKKTIVTSFLFCYVHTRFMQIVFCIDFYNNYSKMQMVPIQTYYRTLLLPLVDWWLYIIKHKQFPQQGQLIPSKTHTHTHTQSVLCVLLFLNWIVFGTCVKKLHLHSQSLKIKRKRIFWYDLLCSVSIRFLIPSVQESQLILANLWTSHAG